MTETKERNNMKKIKSLSAYLLALMLVFTLSACGGSAQTPPQPDSGSAIHSGDTLDTGAASFTVEVIDADKQQITFTVQTDEQTVGAALQKLALLTGKTASTACISKRSMESPPTTIRTAPTGPFISTASMPRPAQT